METKNYITPKGFKRLTDEQEHLLRVERPEITKLVKWAASLGDRSENADYIYGKKKLREIDRRLRFLAKRIDSAEVVDPQKMDSEKIQFGATVVLENQNDESTKRYSIVGVDELDPARGYISWKSPVAKALIGKECGDEVIIKTPRGEIDYEVLSVEYVEINMESNDDH